MVLILQFYYYNSELYKHYKSELIAYTFNIGLQTVIAVTPWMWNSNPTSSWTCAPRFPLCPTCRGGRQKHLSKQHTVDRWNRNIYRHCHKATMLKLLPKTPTFNLYFWEYFKTFYERFIKLSGVDLNQAYHTIHEVEQTRKDNVFSPV